MVITKQNKTKNVSQKRQPKQIQVGSFIFGRKTPTEKNILQTHATLRKHKSRKEYSRPVLGATLSQLSNLFPDNMSLAKSVFQGL